MFGNSFGSRLSEYVYLLGCEFKIQTDHRALQWLDRLKDNNPRLARWNLALQLYKFVVEHRAGTLKGNADALSRVWRKREECKRLNCLLNLL